MQVISLPTGQFCMLFLLSADFFKINFFEKVFQEYHQSVKQFGCRSGLTFVGPDPIRNCLQKLSADDTSRPKGRCPSLSCPLDSWGGGGGGEAVP